MFPASGLIEIQVEIPNKDVEVTDDSTISTTTHNNGDTTITIRDFTITDKAYSIENVVLSGADASNYLLTSNLITGTDGRITQRPYTTYLPKKSTTVIQIWKDTPIQEAFTQPNQ